MRIKRSVAEFLLPTVVSGRLARHPGEDPMLSYRRVVVRVAKSTVQLHSFAPQPAIKGYMLQGSTKYIGRLFELLRCGTVVHPRKLSSLFNYLFFNIFFTHKLKRFQIDYLAY